MPVVSVTQKAHAKVNLCLRVVNKRNDGYHNIESLVMPIDLSDKITVTTTDDSKISISCNGYSELETDDNLCVKAARWFYDRADVKTENQGIKIELEKNIPVAAGLGGGSSDAACILRILQQIHSSPLEENTLKMESWRLGADIPVCFDSKSRWISGVGEVLGEVVEIEKLWILLLNPGYEVSTSLVYESYNKNLDSARLTNTCNSGRKSQRNFDCASVKELLYNDLESVTLQQYPDLLKMEEVLRDSDAEGVLMTGSGPTLFAIFNDEQGAYVTKQQLELRFPDWGIWLTSNFLTED